jgi:DNA gyrase subunit A
MKTAYIDYSMSVIVSRALPDVRDGLKPVHRRVLYGMTELGLSFNRPYKKSARIVGEVLGKYHPHGDTAVYDTMVRMAQPWSMRYMLVDGQGNFGSIDGDSPAAMRYTEARLTKIAEEILSDIDKDTVDFRANFDESLQEPTVMPTRIPNLLLNGASGIAVGMATNMAPHNLSEVIDGIIAYIDNKEITIDELIKFIKAPDFPTGGILYGYSGIKQAFETGRGRVVIRAKVEIEVAPGSGRDKIIVSEIPYMVNKAAMIGKTADLINEKVIDGIAELRDESDRDGLRIVYEIRKDSDANVVLNNLYKHTQLQSSFSINNIALVNGRPMMLNLKDMIHYFVEHRHDVVVRRTKYELAEAEKRAHILEGLLIALDNLDEVINLIRSSRTPDDAKAGLVERFGLSELQAKAILDLRLQRLTGLERDKLKEEFDELMKLITYLKSVLADEGLRMQIIKDELIEIKTKFGDARRSEIVYSSDEFSMEDFVADEDMVITISHLGYIKRTPAKDYKAQGRGGKGSKGAASRDEDFIEQLFVSNAHSYLMFFTDMGKCFWLRVFEIPEGTRTTKGRALQNIINLEPNDKVRTILPVKSLTDEEYINNNFIFFATKQGVIKKSKLEAYSRPRQKGIIAINIDENDELIGVVLTDDNSDIILATSYGQAIRFDQSKVRPIGRNATGVRGVRLQADDDQVVGIIRIKSQEDTILVLSENGYGKRSLAEEYRVTNRGGKGIRTINITEKTGKLIGILNVDEEHDLIIINKSGITIRMNIESIRTMGRNTQGVRLINLSDSDSIASIAVVDKEEEEEIDLSITEGESSESNDIQASTDADETSSPTESHPE